MEGKRRSTEDILPRKLSTEKVPHWINQPPTSPMSTEEYKQTEAVLVGSLGTLGASRTLGLPDSEVFDQPQSAYAIPAVPFDNPSCPALATLDKTNVPKGAETSLTSQFSEIQHPLQGKKASRDDIYISLNAVRSESQNSVENETSKDKEEARTYGTPKQEIQVSTLNWSYSNNQASPLHEPKKNLGAPLAVSGEIGVCQEYPDKFPMDEVEEAISQVVSATQIGGEPDNLGPSLRYYKENPQLDVLPSDFTMPYRYFSQFGNEQQTPAESRPSNPTFDAQEQDLDGNRIRPTQQTASVPHSSRVLEFSNSLLPTIRSMDSSATKEGGFDMTVGGLSLARPATPEGPHLSNLENEHLWGERLKVHSEHSEEEPGKVYADHLESEETVGDKIVNDLLEALIEESISEQQEIKFRLNVCPQDGQLKFGDDISAIEGMYGIRTNIISIGEYLHLLVDFLLETQSDELVAKYNQGYDLDPSETIRILRENEVHMYMSEGENQDLMGLSPEYEWQELPMGYLLDQTIFEVLKSEMLSNLEDSTEMGRLIHLQGVFHKSIFDCFNEIVSTLWQRDVAIDFVRLVMYRKQQPLKKLSGREDLEKILCYAKDVAMEYASMLCGTIKDKEDSLVGGLRGIDSNGLNQLREDRLIKMLAMEIFDKEKFWVNYSQEILISLIDCSDKVCEDLVTEVVEDFIRIAESR